MLYMKLRLRNLETKLISFSTSFLESLQPCRGRDIIVGVVLLLIALSVYASMCTDALINGDAAVYVQQMRNLEFSKRPVHIGYYLLGAAFLRIIPGSDDYAVNLMNCLFGALTVALVYFVTFVICHRALVALFSGLFLLTHYIFLENSVYAEVYAPSACFLLLAFFLWLLDRPVIAGISFALSLLITTSGIFAVPLFFIVRPRFRAFFLFCVVVLTIAAVAVFPVYKDYLFGGRGLLTIALHQAFDLGYILRREAGEIFFSFFLCIPFVVVGVAALFIQRNLRPLGVGLLTLWAVSLSLGEKNWNDFPVQLPTYVLLCPVSGFGVLSLFQILNKRRYATIISATVLLALMAVTVLIKATEALPQVSRFLPAWFAATVVFCGVLLMFVAILPRLRRIRAQSMIVCAASLAFAVNGFVAFSKIAALNKYHTGYRNSVIEVSRVTGPDYVLVGHWSQFRLFEHYLFQESYTPHCTCISVRALASPADVQQSDALKRFNEAIAARRQILLLGNYSGLFRPLQRFGYRIVRFGYIYLADQSS